MAKNKDCHIKEFFDESKGTYGYRRICEDLLIKYGLIFNLFYNTTRLKNRKR